MNRIEEIESQVRNLSDTELAAFREWFAHFDAEMWDRQIEADASLGRLDALAERAISQDRDGQSRPL